jgi:hypothetical protein
MGLHPTPTQGISIVLKSLKNTEQRRVFQHGGPPRIVRLPMEEAIQLLVVLLGVLSYESADGCSVEVAVGHQDLVHDVTALSNHHTRWGPSAKAREDAVSLLGCLARGGIHTL